MELVNTIVKAILVSRATVTL